MSEERYNAILNINSHARWVQPENERIRLVSTHVNRTWSIVIFAAYLYLWSLSLSDLLFLPTPSPSLSSESTEQLTESHAVNADPVIPPTSTHIVAEAAILSSQPASAVPSISATTDTAGAAQSSTTAPIRNPTSGEPPKNLATTTTIGVRTDEVG